MSPRILLILLVILWVLLAVTVSVTVASSGINTWLGIAIALNAWLGGLVFSAIFYEFVKDRLTL